MKKFIALITILFCLSFMVQAQESATYDYDMKYDKTWLASGLSAADSIGETDSTWFFTVRKFNTELVKPTIRVVLDKIDGTPCNVTVKLQYKTWPKDPWKTETTVTYTGTVDTAIAYSTTTAKVGDYWKVDVKGATDDFHVVIDSVYFKFVY